MSNRKSQVKSAKSVQSSGDWIEDLNGQDIEEITGMPENHSDAEKQTRTRRYVANVYLDSSDLAEFYLIVAAGTVVYAVFSFEPATCKATNKSGSRMMLAAARGLLKDKANLVKLASVRLEKSELSSGCHFHADNFGEVYSALFGAFIALMPKPDAKSE